MSIPKPTGPAPAADSKRRRSNKPASYGAAEATVAGEAGVPAKPQDYVSLRAELAVLVNDFTPVISELWPRLEDHKYRWELHSYGLSEGCDKRVVSDIIATLIEALKAIRIADNKLLQAHTKADHRSPGGPDAA